MRRLVQLRSPFGVVWDVVMEKECRAKKTLHRLGILRERDRLDGFLASLRQLPTAMRDFVTEKGHCVHTNPALLHLQDHAVLLAPLQDLLKLLVGILMVICQD